MRTWDDMLQHNMLLDALNFNNNPLVGLPTEYLISCTPSLKYVTVANNGGMTYCSDMNYADTTNFLLGIPFAADSSHMEGLSRTGNDINWIIEGEIICNRFIDVGAGVKNMLGPNFIFYTAVCDWKLDLSSSDSPYPNQTSSTQYAFNF
jgi:hypothetical protein